MTTPISVSDTKPSDWKYISEGGATIVFSYVGPSNLLLDGTALRLRKISHNLPVGFSLLEHEEPDDPMIELQHRCMERLVPPSHLPRLESVTVSQPWLEAMIEAKDSDRPPERRAKDGIDICRKKAVLATDLVGGKGLVAEIKPKWGFLPSLVHLSPETLPIKSRTCRFCMHSRLKASEGASVAYDFCPLDLYSKDPARITIAIECLWDEWVETGATINNLKIFIDGHTYRPSMDLSPLGETLGSESNEANDIKASFVKAAVAILASSPLLSIISTLQRNLDVLDIEGLSRLWSEVHPPNDDGVPSTIGLDEEYLPHANPTLDEWSHFIDLYLSDEFREALDPLHPRSKDLAYYLLAYLLSATFKDCSIILRLEPGKERSTVIDLDPKGLERLHKWEALDSKIVSHYANLDSSQRRTCIDDSAV